jgi:hypothetical protein
MYQHTRLMYLKKDGKIMKDGHIANKAFNDECELFFHNYGNGYYYGEKYGFRASKILQESVNIARQTFNAWITPDDKINAILELKNLFVNSTTHLVFNREHRREISKHVSNIAHELMRIYKEIES